MLLKTQEEQNCLKNIFFISFNCAIPNKLVINKKLRGNGFFF